MNRPFPVLRKLSSLLAALALCSSCGGDRAVAGGTSGAEAENALSLRVLGPDGLGAPGAKVVARPAESLTDSVRIASVADADGIALLSLPASTEWIVEVVRDTLAAQVSIPRGKLPDTVRPLVLGRRSRLEGRLVGVRAGTVVHLAGLGRNATVDSAAAVSFADLPSGRWRLRCADAAWTLEASAGETIRVSLDTAQGGISAGDPDKPLVHVGSLLPATGPDALLALELDLPASLSRSISRLKLTSGTGTSGQDLSLQVTAWDSVSRRLRVWTRTPADFSGGSLNLVLDTLRSGERVSNPFQGRGMATAVFFSNPPTRSGTLDAWTNHSQPGRNLVVLPSVGWQADSSDPLASGIVSADRSEMLSLGSELVTPDLSRISVRLRFLQGWEGWSRILRITDSTGAVLVELVRTGDSLKVSDGRTVASSRVPQDTVWHQYTWMRTASDWRVYVDSRHLLTLDAPSLRPAGVTVAEGGRIRMSELMLWADTTVRETVPVGGISKGIVVPPLR